VLVSRQQEPRPTDTLQLYILIYAEETSAQTRKKTQAVKMIAFSRKIKNKKKNNLRTQTEGVGFKEKSIEKVRSRGR